jgi:hypothetical protein
MIPAPANVLSRLSTIVMDYENLVAGWPRDNTHQGIAEFLKLYFDGRTELPPDESNGNNQVSRYKVAADSWRQLDEIFRRTGDTRYEATRDLVARLMPTPEALVLITSSKSTAKMLSRAERARGWLNIEASF